MKAVAIILLGALVGCAAEPCEKAATSLSLQIAGPNPPGGHRLALVLALDNQRWRQTYPLTNQLADGMTSVAVELGARTEPFTIEIEAEILSSEGQPMAAGRGSWVLAPNGCNQVLLVLQTSQPDAGAGDPDGGAPDGEEDTGGSDSGELDGGVAEAGPDAEPDAGADDAGLPDASERCSSPDPDTVALYPFDSQLTEVIGGVNALPGEDPESYRPGYCGQALSFSRNPSVHDAVVIPAVSHWLLAEGSVDFWLYPAASTARYQGVLGHEANPMPAVGSLGIYLNCDGYLVAKLHHNQGDVYRCSREPLRNSVWHHIGLNFGPAGFELWVDHAPADRTGALPLGGEGCSQDIVCGGNESASLTTNFYPWVVGAAADESPTGEPSGHWMRGGAVDHLRISRARRDYAP